MEILLLKIEFVQFLMYWNKASSFNNTKNAFNQAGFFVTLEFITENEMNKLFLEKVKTDYSIVELVKCSVIFSLEHSRKLRKRLLTEFVPTPMIPSKETISIEYESTKTKRFD